MGFSAKLVKNCQKWCFTEMSKWCFLEVSKNVTFWSYFRQFSFQTLTNPYGSRISGKTRKFTEKHRKTPLLAILTKNPYQSLWKMPILTVLTSPDTTGPIHRTRLTEGTKTPYQTSWKVSKCVKKVTFLTHFNDFSDPQVCR